MADQSKLRAAAVEALEALLRVRPQVNGALPEQDCDSAIRALKEALADCSSAPIATQPPSP